MSRGTSSRAGALAIGGAKAWFLVAGLAQNIVTPWAIGQEGFGTYKRALAFVNVVNNVIVVASIQAVSRAVAAEDEAARGPTLRRALVLHACLGLALGGLFFAAIPLIVAHQHAPQLAPLLRVLALVIVAYGAYAPLVGALNGARFFGRQAALDATFSTVRTLLTALVGIWFVRSVVDAGARSAEGALGAVVGFFATALFILPVAAALTPLRGTAEPSFDRRSHLSFLASVAFAQLFQSLLLQADLVILGRLATLDFVARGLGDTAAQASADRLAGLYAQAQAFGLVPYQLLLAAAYVLFPAIAAARARADESTLKREIDRGGRATLLVAGALVAAIASTPIAVLRFAFGRGAPNALPTEIAAPILRNLTLAHGCTAMAMIGVTLLAAAGQARRAALLSAMVAALSITGAWAAGRFLPGSSPREAMAPIDVGTCISLGMLIGLAIAVVIVVVTVARVLGPYVRWATALRVSVGLGLALGVGAFVPVPSSRVLCAFPPLVPLGIYVIVVAALGEPVRTLLVGERRAR